ncbi:5'-3' exoribonuclease 3-like [Cornus florida]|uniref:5'-3' exoribonuclease 3-like n=1 Tax=Cornus florida TaxID=4283 RepID=UPI0028A277FC|nr:5'-3' exoribonuclease 3-like [Cornus florida]
MGVPSFYRWLANKYPEVVVNAKEEKGDDMDTSSPNPNGIEFDNLYLDMNGIIHPCFHPDDNLFPPTTFEAVFNNIFEYIDRIFNIVRPRKLLYMAIDGVAPRAKMNQQRSRRFKTAKDNENFEAEEERLRKQFEMEGKPVLPKQESEVSDSNIITPGTEFMYKLSKELQRYIWQRIDNDAGWKEIKVILSDANVPGEGEHKIMSFIRLQRTSPDYNPNTRHCLYGLDADLIMLALATHEIHFSILREDVVVQEQTPSYESAIEASICEAKSSSERSTGCFKQAQADKTSSLIKKPYQFLNVWILREYLELDMEISDPPENFKVDFERIVDDFVFICFFAGNDFLPHMPSLEIHEGAIDLLMHVYKKEFKNLKGYLVDMQRVDDKKGGYLKLSRLERFILSVGTFEETIFKKRSELQERKLRRILYDLEDAKGDEEENSGGISELNTRDVHCGMHNGRVPTSGDSTNVTSEEILKNTKELKEKLKCNLRKTSDVFKNGGFKMDKVKLGAAGWRERYYKEKFSADTAADIESTRKAIVEKYAEGLCWVLLYYFCGVPSWMWYYPYHYGPFASDLKGLGKLRVRFQKGLPFKPFDQLMGVLPPRSSHALPKGYRALMTDEASTIIDFYPNDFDVDINGKRFMWQGICKLPFIEEERLLTVSGKLEKDLKEDEVIRNTVSVDQLFMRSSTKLGLQILSIYKNQAAKEQSEMIKIDTSLSEGINGFVRPTLLAVNSDGPENEIQDHNVLSVFYELPRECLHIPRPLEGVEFPQKTITAADIVETQLWHESQGSRPSIRPQYQQKYHGSRANNNRPQYQERYRNDFTPNSTPNSSPGVMVKCAGSGWGAGRGKEYTATADFRGFDENSRRIQFGYGDTVGARGRVGHHVVSPHEQNFKSGTFQGTYAMSSIQGEPNGFGDLKIAEANQGFNTYGRAQSVNHNSWSSGNGGRAQPMNHNSWSSGNRGTAQPMNHNSWSSGNRGTAQPMNHNSWSSGNGGRGQAVNHTSSWSSGNGSMPSRNYGWRPTVQSTGTPLGHGSTSSGNNQWRQSMQLNPASFGHGPRGSTSNGNYEWRQCVQSTASPIGQGRGGGQMTSSTENTSQTRQHSLAATASMQAHGRGQYVPNASAPNWNSRNNPRNSGH